MAHSVNTNFCVCVLIFKFYSYDLYSAVICLSLPLLSCILASLIFLLLSIPLTITSQSPPFLVGFEFVALS